MIRLEIGPDAWRLCSDAVVADRPSACSIYSLFQLLLGFNYFWCVQRLLLMLTIFKRIGVLYEIIQRILKVLQQLPSAFCASVSVYWPVVMFSAFRRMMFYHFW